MKNVLVFVQTVNFVLIAGHMVLIIYAKVVDNVECVPSRAGVRDAIIAADVTEVVIALTKIACYVPIATNPDAIYASCVANVQVWEKWPVLTVGSVLSVKLTKGQDVICVIDAQIVPTNCAQNVMGFVVTVPMPSVMNTNCAQAA